MLRATVYVENHETGELIARTIVQEPLTSEMEYVWSVEQAALKAWGPNITVSFGPVGQPWSYHPRRRVA